MAALRLGVVGCGGRGRLYARLAGRLDGLTPVAYADCREEAARAALNEFGGEYATADVTRIWRDDSLDAVVIATWHDTHTPYCLAAAQAGLHLLVEKPLALTVAECDRIGEAVEAAGVTLVTGFKLHCAPVVRAVKARLGTPQMICGQMMDNPWPATSWATQPGTGGGNVLSQGCHSADLLRLLAGGEAVRVSAEGGTFSGQHPDVIDNAVAVVGYDNGVVAALVQGDLGVNPHLSKFCFQAWGRDGLVVHLDQRLRRALLQPRGGPVEELRAEQLVGEDPDQVEGDLALVQAFVDAVGGHGPAVPGLREATAATRLINAVFESLRYRRTVTLG